MSARVRPELLQRLVVLLVPVIVTAPRFWNGFVFDDLYVIVRGDFIHHLSNLPRVFETHAMAASSLEAAFGETPIDTYRPISIASFFWDSVLSGRAPWAYHLTNTVLHGLNCLLVLELLRRLCSRAPPVLCVGLTLCFGLAPWLAEAHVWINGRSDLFLALFTLCSALLQRAALTHSRFVWALASAALSLLGLLSKESAVLMLPFVLLVPTGRAESLSQRARFGVPHALVFALYLVLRAHALHGLRAHVGAAHTAAALSNLPLLWVDCVVHVLLPLPYFLRNLRDDYAAVGEASRIAAGFALTATLVALSWAWRRGASTVAWGLGLALSTLAPSVMITTELWQGFGRFLYLPAIGLFVVVCDLMARADQLPLRSQKLLRGFVLLLAVVSSALLIDGTLGFHDDLRLYRRALAESPEQGWTYGSVGLTLKRDGDCYAAIPLLARADAMAPREPRYLNNLARCLIQVGDLASARSAARAGQARFHDTGSEASFLMDEFLTLSSDEARSELVLARCLQLVPQHTDCLRALADVRARQSGKGPN
ncbi:MAG: hypothetical protein JWN04_6204 [Myxococcaceae bacterium]|nr:hypothetical protein [Myxococcaceae bacterium]